MKATQYIEKKRSYEDRKEVLIKKIQEIVESDQLTKMDIDRYLCGTSK